MGSYGQNKNSDIVINISQPPNDPLSLKNIDFPR